MRTYKKVEETKYRDKLEAIICDWCDKSYKHECEFDGRNTVFDVDEFTFEWRTGVSYPEGGHGEKKTIDICHECRQRIMDLLASNGVEIREKEWDIG